MFKRQLLKAMLGSKLKNVPEAQQDMIFDLIEKNPDLFKEIAEEIQAGVSAGKDQMAVTMEVMERYKPKIEDALRN
jgi:hypothetical protein